MLQVASNSHLVASRVSTVRRRAKPTKTSQGVIDAISALAGIALVFAGWYGLNLLMKLSDSAPFAS